MKSRVEAPVTTPGRNSDLLDNVDYQLARTPAEKEAIYNLRYRAYLREGAVKESPEQRVVDQYEDLPNSWTFGVYLRGELCSSVRISVLTPEWRQSCSAEAFGEILHPRLDRGEVIIDPARFVADPDRAKRYPELPYVTLRLAYLACEYFNANLGLAIVRGIVGSGAMNLNPTVITVTISAASAGGTAVHIRGAAKEGLIKQRAGHKAAERFAVTLT